MVNFLAPLKGEPIAFVGHQAVQDGDYAPEPYVIVGSLPAGVIAPAATVAPAVVATDATSVGNQFNALLTSLRAAGLLV
ncbi:hypothetical protein [Frigoribacterium sp. UYMn621]|uniref:hypothetical protein n=1 Tax=Frigoribacterium sp. UYMn621 TaxID=3156343 RepID=UPI0033998CF2